MMSLCHGCGWQPPQTASHFHIRHMQSVWAHWHAVHCHRVAALHSYTHCNWIRFWGSGSLVESKWCHYDMVEADCNLKLLPTSKLNIYTMIEHIDMLSMGIQDQPYTVIPTLPLKNQFGIWRYKFPLQIKSIWIISNIFLNFSIIMFYLQENYIQVRIPLV